MGQGLYLITADHLDPNSNNLELYFSLFFLLLLFLWYYQSMLYTSWLPVFFTWQVLVCKTLHLFCRACPNVYNIDTTCEL